MIHRMIFIILIVRKKRMKISNKIQEDWANTVNRIVNPEIIEKITGNELIIREFKKETKNPEVHIRNLKSSCYAFKMDLEPRSIYLFKESLKINDELLLYIEDDKITVFIIELKSNHPEKAIVQIRFGKIYADFLIGIIEEEVGYIFQNKKN